MTKRTPKEVKRHLASGELRKLIREEQKRGKVLQRLIFINDLYEGKSGPSAAKHAGVVKTIAYEWLRRWSKSGYEDLIPRFAGGKPSKLSGEQKNDLMALLKAKDLWYLGDIKDLIKSEFNTEYSERQVRRILKSFKMNHAKPYQVDYRKPEDADEKLKKL
ncbi:MAG: transposase [Candidatus Thermoplasmatota archaeon]|nr:transposase [Candidatus Thermoplasmatota archaeon]